VIKSILSATALCVTFGANAQVAGSLGGGYGSFLTLSSSVANPVTTPNAGGTLGGIYAITGGSVYGADQTFASIPEGTTIFGGNFLAAGPTAGAPATINFGAAGIDYISFLWGSADLYNVLTVNSTGGSQTFVAGAAGVGQTSLGFSSTSGNQSVSQYVQFDGIGANRITSLVFNNNPQKNAFETANYSITPVPEPETYALLLAGLGVVGFMARRRKSV
jgi:hypothetical protein